MPLICRDIATALKVPLEAVESNWPIIVAALKERGILSDLVEVAVAATVYVETARTFKPIHEFGGTDAKGYFSRRYENRRDLGNVKPGDGALFHGRGYVQITGRSNYRAAGKMLGVDLEASPELALVPEDSAKILAHFFWIRHIDLAANAREWDTVRARVNGGTNGLTEFRNAVQKLLEVLHA